MSVQLNKFQMTNATSWKGLTKANSLAALWGSGQDTQKISNMVTDILSYNFGNNIDTFLKKFPTKVLDNEDDFVWELRGNAPKNVKLEEASFNGSIITSSTSDEIGKGGTEIELRFEKDLFSKGDLIVGENPDDFALYIKAYEYDGSYYTATCVINTGDPNVSVPAEDLVAGTYWSVEYHAVEAEFSSDGGEVIHTSNISMRNGFTHIRMKQKNPGNMVGRKLIGTVLGKDANGKEMLLWTDYQSYKIDYELRMQWNRALMFGKSNRSQYGSFNITGDSGYQIKTGAGIREQMETANTTSYTTFDIDEFSSRLMDLSEGKLETDDRAFVGRCGERFAYQFHKALEDYSQLFTPTREMERIGKANADFIGSNKGLSYGGQFVEYMGPNGIKFNLSVDGIYSDPTRNKKIHPDNGLEESYRCDIFDIGTTEEEPNIQLYQAGNLGMVKWYIEGARSPYSWNGSGYNTPRSAASPIDGWEEHCMVSGAAVVKDPTRTATFKYGSSI